MQCRDDGTSLPGKKAPNARSLRKRHKPSPTTTSAARLLPLGRSHAADGEEEQGSLEGWSCVQTDDLHENSKDAAELSQDGERKKPRSSSTLSISTGSLQNLGTESSSPDQAHHVGVSRRHLHAYRNASRYPPVTKDSLSELDIVMIINNPKLRHDVNFDRALHFRPNDDGEQGLLKKGLAEQYWLALVPELTVLVLSDLGDGVSPAHNAKLDFKSLQKLVKEGPKRVPIMLRVIKDILKTLVPERDHGILDETLDVPLIMQQIQRHTCDLAKLSQWLATLLKTHCAPMRDSWVDDMVGEIGKGLQIGDMNILVDGLRLLFGILEAMKLDVANHQTRSLRPLLIEDTINFEQRYFLSNIANLQIGIRHATDWYRNTGLTLRSQLTRRKGADKEPHLARFLDALIATTFSATTIRRLPDPFRFDAERIQLLHADIRGTIMLDICSRLYSCLLQSSGYNRPTTGQTINSLHDSIISIVTTGESSAKWTGDAGNIASEIVRFASKTCNISIPSQCDYVEQLERHLKDGFRQDSELYVASQLRLEERLSLLVDEYVQTCSSLSELEIFNLADPRKVGQISDVGFRGLNDIAVRLAHIGILHWRVWGPLLYARANPELSGCNDAGDNRDHPAVSSRQH
ncbi:Tcp11-domain-containing protein [Xylona heveae TC161]|uniref:Tcp11-domain-containing protein n=1 Tax=Xylona heveae (strain CBS 132557 / TC161) TaxID=1328760 RepID=A0A165J4N7_XYLHT|nr:Tcp11-domain-containing protein [Xylona heveae TC161]KZF25726.1 Tcp11-domain-containing protein [Xylona heveae TC161]